MRNVLTIVLDSDLKEITVSTCEIHSSKVDIATKVSLPFTVDNVSKVWKNVVNKYPKDTKLITNGDDYKLIEMTSRCRSLRVDEILA